jgi:hypothetical protein
MYFYKFLIIFCLILPLQTWPMKRFTGKFRSNSTGSSFFKRPIQGGYKPFDFKPFSAGMFSLRSGSFFTPTFRTSLHQRSFSSSPSVFSMWDSISWKFKSQEQQEEELFKAFADKIKSKSSQFFPNLTLEQLIQKIALEGLINCSLTFQENPLIFAIMVSRTQPEEQQENLIKLLLRNGANLNERALLIAIRHLNSGALKVLQLRFEPKDLLKHYVEVYENIQDILHNCATYRNMPHQLEAFRKILNVLESPCKEGLYTKGSYIKIDEFNSLLCEETIATNSCKELYALLFKNKKYNPRSKQNESDSYYNGNHNYEYLNNHGTSQPDILYDPTKYTNPSDHELYKTFIQANKKNIQLKEIFGLKQATTNNEIKTAYMQLVYKFHPDRFNHDQDLHKMATEVTKRLNQMKKIHEF